MTWCVDVGRASQSLREQCIVDDCHAGEPSLAPAPSCVVLRKIVLRACEHSSGHWRVAAVAANACVCRAISVKETTSALRSHAWYVHQRARKLSGDCVAVCLRIGVGIVLSSEHRQRRHEVAHVARHKKGQVASSSCVGNNKDAARDSWTSE